MKQVKQAEEAIKQAPDDDNGRNILDSSNLCILRCLGLLNSLLDDNESYIQGRLMSHGASSQGSKLTLFIQNGCSRSPTKGKRLPINVFTNDSIIRFREKVSGVVKVEVSIIS